MNVSGPAEVSAMLRARRLLLLLTSVVPNTSSLTDS
jgi:hypothetical protein